MSRKEAMEQLESLIEDWQLDEADLNQTDIDAIKLLLDENHQLKEQLKQRDEVIEEAIEWTEQKIKSCTVEANATTNDTLCRITIVGLKWLLSILTKYKGDKNGL